MKTLLCLNTGGINDLHGLRMRRLTRQLEGVDCTHVDLDRSRSRWENARSVWSLLRSGPWDLVYQESTGLAGGLPLILAARAYGQPYIVSSGDPIGGYFHVVNGPLHGAALGLYEKWLYRSSAGFVGWTPYLTGAALTLGAPRAVTVEGAVDRTLFRPYSPEKRSTLKADYGLDPDHVVCGIVGSLKWTPRQSYCYGLELIEMLPYLNRPDVSVLIVGDGDGRVELERRVPPEWRDRVVFTGRVAEHEVVDALNAMDIGFITQTLDALGSYRLTTKLPEYLATGLPVAMSPIPGYYDYVGSAGWSLPPHHPAHPSFHRACAAWLDSLSREDIDSRRPYALQQAATLDYEGVRPKFERFVYDVLGLPIPAAPSLTDVPPALVEATGDAQPSRR